MEDVSRTYLLCPLQLVVSEELFRGCVRTQEVRPLQWRPESCNSETTLPSPDLPISCSTAARYMPVEIKNIYILSQK